MLVKRIALFLCLLMSASIVFANSEAVIDSGDNTLFNDIALDSEGNPVVAYWNLNEGELRLVRCANPNCTGSAETQLIAEGNSGFFFITIAISADNRAYINYFDNEASEIQLAICENPECDAVNIVSIGETGSSGQVSSMILDADGFPVIAYYTEEEFHLAHCEDADCEEISDSSLGDDNSSNPDLDLELDADGNPVIALAHAINNDLSLVGCDSPNCDGSGVANPVDDDDVGSIDSIAMELTSEGNPVIAYYSLSENGLMLARCEDLYCEDATIDKLGDMRTVADVSLVLDEEDRPIIVYLQGMPGDVYVLSCEDSACEDSNDVSLDARGQFVNIVLDAEGFPVISFDNFGSSSKGLAVIHCESRSCE